MIEDIYKKFKEKYPCIDELLYENKKWIIKTNDINKNIDIIKLCEKLVPYIEKNLNNNDNILLELNDEKYKASFYTDWKFKKVNKIVYHLHQNLDANSVITKNKEGKFEITDDKRVLSKIESQKKEEIEKLKINYKNQLDAKNKELEERDKEIEELKKNGIVRDDKINYSKLLSDINEIKEGEFKLSELGVITETAKKTKNKKELENKQTSQVFTRETEIKKMINSIGWETILNPETTILEPTAGDGAFTARILIYRLRKIFKESNTLNEYLLKSLIALSTIYAIEYEDVTCYTQRINIYTLMKCLMRCYLYKIDVKENNITDEWDEIVKKIIFDNIMWGAFAATNHPEYKNYEKILGFDRASNRPLVIIKWSFSIDKKGKIKYKKEVIG